MAMAETGRFPTKSIDPGRCDVESCLHPGLESVTPANRMWTLFEIGGPVLWLLFGCSIVMVGIYLERQVALHRYRVYLHDFLPGLVALLREHRFSEAMQICAGTPGPVARVCRNLILQGRDASFTELRQVGETNVRLELPALERHLPFLAAICYLAPLLGLLGTFWGLLGTFSASDGLNALEANRFTEGIYAALINASAGLMIAIPGYAAYLLLYGQIRRMLHEMERAIYEVSTVLVQVRGGERDGIIAFEPRPGQGNVRTLRPE